MFSTPKFLAKIRFCQILQAWETFKSWMADLNASGVLRVNLGPRPGTISGAKMAPKSFKNLFKKHVDFRLSFVSTLWPKMTPNFIEKSPGK